MRIRGKRRKKGKNKAKWNAISKERGWNSGTRYYTIRYTDGDIAKS